MGNWYCLKCNTARLKLKTNQPLVYGFYASTYFIVHNGILHIFRNIWSSYVLDITVVIFNSLTQSQLDLMDPGGGPT